MEKKYCPTTSLLLLYTYRCHLTDTRRRSSFHPPSPFLHRARRQATSQEYDGTKSKQAKKVEAAAANDGAGDGLLDMFDEILRFLDEEFWLIFFAVIYAFSIIFFTLAIMNKLMGSRHSMWNWIIGLFIPWFIVTTMYLIDPRIEQWSVAMVTKIYFRLQELRHREGLTGVKQAVLKW